MVKLTQRVKYQFIIDPAKFVKISNFSIKPLASQKEWPVWKRKIRDLLDYRDGALQVVHGKNRNFSLKYIFLI